MWLVVVFAGIPFDDVEWDMVFMGVVVFIACALAPPATTSAEMAIAESMIFFTDCSFVVTRS